MPQRFVNPLQRPGRACHDAHTRLPRLTFKYAFINQPLMFLKSSRVALLIYFRAPGLDGYHERISPCRPSLLQSFSYLRSWHGCRNMDLTLERAAATSINTVEPFRVTALWGRHPWQGHVAFVISLDDVVITDSVPSVGRNPANFHLGHCAGFDSGNQRYIDSVLAIQFCSNHSLLNGKGYNRA